MKRLVLALSISMLLCGAASAFPKYSQKEKKPCSFCHVNPKGGGKRTEAGIYYKTHNLSLVGYKPSAPAKPKPKK